MFLPEIHFSGKSDGKTETKDADISPGQQGKISNPARI